MVFVLFSTVRHDLCFDLLLMVLWESTLCTVFCSLCYTFLCTMFFCTGYLTLACCLADSILCKGISLIFCLVVNDVPCKVPQKAVFCCFWSSFPMLHIRTCNILCSVTSVLCFVACISMPCIFLGFPLCFWNISQIAFVYKLFHRSMSRKPRVRIKSIQYHHFKMSGFQILLSGVG